MALVRGFTRTLRWLARSHEGRNFGLAMLAFALVMAAVLYRLGGPWHTGTVLALSAFFGSAWPMARAHEGKSKHTHRRTHP